MKIKIFLFFLLVLLKVGSAQQPQVLNFVRDTMSVPDKGKILEGEYLEVTLKNLSVVRLFKTTDNKYFLRFIVTKNFYFDKTATLEIKSGNKSYYAKETTQHKISKTAGLFLIEVYRNYIATLRDDGITALVFGEAETTFTKQDAALIKKMAGTFYESISPSSK